jgi:hypothetical protein
VAADWLDAYMAYTDGNPTPEIYRLWSGIAVLAGCMERRFWTRTAGGATFPNMYVALTGSPNVGKSKAIDPARDLWMATKDIHVAPTSMTSAAMLDSLIESKRIIHAEGQIKFEYHSMVVPAAEFAVFCNAFDKEFLGRLCTIWDCEPNLRVRRKYIKEEIAIVCPQITLLAGAQPGFLHSVLPEEAWAMGFPARLMMIYSDVSPKVDLWKERPANEKGRLGLIARLKDLVKAHGQLQWQPKAQIALSAWYNAGFPPVPSHDRLQNYNGKRITTVIKLAMISAAARDNCATLTVTLEDFDRARAWMLDAESVMPDIFKNMMHTSDSALIHELYNFICHEFIRRQSPVHGARLHDFLRYRIKNVDRSAKIIEAMVSSGILDRARGHSDLFIPIMAGAADAKVHVSH